MAKGKKTGGRDFKLGQVGNPLGAGAHNKDVKRIRRLAKDDIAAIGQIILDGNLTELQKIKDDPDASVLKVWMAALIVRSMTKGDAGVFNVIMDRIVGRVKNSLEVMDPGDQPFRPFAHLDGDRLTKSIVLLQKLTQEQEDAKLLPRPPQSILPR